MYIALICSPAGPVARDQSPVRMAPPAPPTTGAGDDTYLFCNVPEHHDLVNTTCLLDVGPFHLEFLLFDILYKLLSKTLPNKMGFFVCFFSAGT